MIADFLQYLENIFITDTNGNPGAIWQALNGMGMKIGWLFVSFSIGKLALFLLNYFFLAFGLFRMAKRRNIQKSWLAFIPFAQLYLMGTLVASTEFFNVKLRYAGLVAMILQIATFALDVTADALALPSLISVFNEDFSSFGFAAYCDAVANIPLAFTFVKWISYVVGLGASICWFVLLYLIFTSYAPKSRMLFLVLSVLGETFFNFSVGSLLIFIIRNNSSDEYREFLKMKMHAMYGGGNPYDYSGGNYKDPYDLSGEGDKKQPPPESPFDEFK